VVAGLLLRGVMVGHYFSCRLARDGDENVSFCQGQMFRLEGFKFLEKAFANGRRSCPSRPLLKTVRSDLR
jgi:hypothetical protein